MIDYSLCKSLKELGFPFKRTAPAVEGLYLWSPTLSELIEACGEWFKYKATDEDAYGVERGIYWDNFAMDDASRWVVFEKHSVLEDLNTISSGATPEEAVANLWINLHSL